MTTLAISSSQYLLARESPDNFMDALVLERSSGLVVLIFIHETDRRLFRIFEAPADEAFISVGEPIGFHGEAGILATDEFWVGAKELIVF